ncbi:MAG TPA: (2Fe-2S)-binding protein [Burkholderiales bacterium]|nr:(2Fe-2S)-binding protein [Burkholderiales bacterium]
MYVCICNPVTDSEVRNCVRAGACSLSDLQMQLGVASQCGMCASAVTAILHEGDSRPASSAGCGAMPLAA